MSEMKFNAKGPVGAVIAVLIIGGFIFYKFFMPFSATSKDRKAIKEELEIIRSQEISMITKMTMEHLKKTGKTRNISKDIKELTGDIDITSIEGKKGFSNRIRVKVTYTIDGKKPKFDGGERYFRLYRRKRSKNSLDKETDVTEINKSDY